MAENLITEIDNYLLKRNVRKRESHYPSDVTSCMRQLYYKWTGEEESNPIEAGGYWKMNIGNALHDMISEFLESTGLDIIHEQPGKEKFDNLKHPVSYRIDNLFVDKDDKLALIEIKTSFGAGIKNIQVLGMPKVEHLAQVCMYMNLVDIQKTYLIYVGRDNGYRTQFLIDYRDNKLCVDGKPTYVDFQELLDKLQELESYLDKEEMPGREFSAAIKHGEIKTKFQRNNVEYKTDWQCNYCQWRNKCWVEYVEQNEKMFYGGKEIE